MIRRKQSKRKGTTRVTFIIPNTPAQPKVYVVGEFNGWDPGANPLVKRSNGTRSAALELKTSRRYAFRYRTSDGEWFNDKAADGYEPSGLGSENCIIAT